MWAAFPSRCSPALAARELQFIPSFFFPSQSIMTKIMYLANSATTGSCGGVSTPLVKSYGLGSPHSSEKALPRAAYDLSGWVMAVGPPWVGSSCQEARGQVLTLVVLSLFSGIFYFHPQTLLFFLSSLHYLAPIFLL